MLNIRNLLLNSQCITKDNFDFVDNGNSFLPLLDEYNRIYLTDEVCFSGMNAVETQEYFFEKDNNIPSWWNKKLCYSFHMLFAEKDNNFFPIDLTIKTHNFSREEMIIKFDLIKLKHDLTTKDTSKKDNIINIFMDSILVLDNNKYIPYYGDYALNLIAKNDISINVFSSLVLSSKTPLLMAIIYLDSTITEGFKVFLTELFSMFISSPFKN